MFEKVKKFIEQEKLLKDKSRVILGVSGGADSIALLDVLQKAGYVIIAAHCNFHLREKESVRDEIFVERFCKEKEITYKKIDFDTIKYAAEYSLSIEMAARELRYRWFEELRHEFDADAIAVGHHRDDSIETMMINMIRGTGIKGLTGIEPKSGYIIRPFLCVTRSEIEKYVADNGLEYVDDSTNSESIYTRNIIRLDVIPYFERINPSARQSIFRTMQNLRQVENIYFSYIDKAKQRVLKNDEVDISKLLKEIEPEAVLFEILSSYGFNSSTVNDAYKSLYGQSGKVFYSDSHRVVKDRDLLLIESVDGSDDDDRYEITENDVEINKPVNLSIDRLKVSENVYFTGGSNTLYVDSDKLQYPLILRKWKLGDWFIPFGMKGKKKLSDFFCDNKFSLTEKENTWLLCSGEDIIWIVGYRADDRYKIVSGSKELMKIKLYP